MTILDVGRNSTVQYCQQAEILQDRIENGTTFYIIVPEEMFFK